jgi:hypothetical protein
MWRVKKEWVPRDKHRCHRSAARRAFQRDQRQLGGQRPEVLLAGDAEAREEYMANGPGDLAAHQCAGQAVSMYLSRIDVACYLKRLSTASTTLKSFLVSCSPSLLLRSSSPKWR